MGTAEKQLEQMRNNPRDWRIGDLVAVAARHGIEIRNHGGSHYVFSYPSIEMAITIPAHRPIKPVYVKQLVALIDQVRRSNR